MATDLDKLKGRLQALRAKTIANGCTEEEALAAAAKVAQLLDQHDLSISDLELRQEQCEQSAIETRRKQRQPISACIPAIADYCDCKVWLEKDEGGIRYVFFGLRPSIEMARYVHDVIAQAMQGGWDSYIRSQRFVRHRHDEKGSFLFGMAVSIAGKLTEMKQDRDEANRRSSGRDLVLVRHAIVDAEYEKLNLNLRKGRASGKKVEAQAFEAGQAAGRSLALHPGVQARRDTGK
ncbi:hypothetical protein CCC_00663 [Paramagnetospirillum magnetotacticum MS-1]|uniref:Uncharacterized protein n=1 Tax=Paramagnetospirillum magnetotacticum MS-1 TaxID=272627 RepID=A0A0C2U821_PARME|nr:DUF2786 domain-containing protein [Paramagnetospirillum magnetotacticum]KIL97602.1 hypothetical protein CCC_00663 [Paramagnetospirillum magnetotacticum MS-1]